MNYREYFKGKKITVMRIGLLVRGVGDTAFLAECGAQVLVVDDASQKVMQPSVDALKKYTNVQFKFGPYNLEDFTKADIVLKGAGAAIDSREIAAAIKADVQVEMSASLVAKLTDATIVGITGTRGKSTVTQLICHILKENNKDVHLAGNIRGVATLPVLDEINKDSIVLMELDSWQLQGFGASNISPHIGVFTTFYADHMDYYKDDMQRYFDDKAQIYKNQKKGDILITTPQSHTAILRYSNVVPNNETIVKPFKTKNPSLLGNHNKENAACAAEVALKLEVSEGDIKKAIETFPGVEGRLQFVREIEGVKIYNDNNATSPEATVAALKALEGNIVLIVGGHDKGLKMHKLVDAIPKYCKAVVLFKENGTDTIRDEVMNLEGIEVAEQEGLEACVQKAVKMAQPGDIILYSPAFASFGKYFKNEYDRNDQFMNIIENL